MKTKTKWFVYTDGGDLRAIPVLKSTNSKNDYSHTIDNVKIYGGSVDGVNYGIKMEKHYSHLITIKEIDKYYDLPDGYDIKVNKKSVKVVPSKTVVK